MIDTYERTICNIAPPNHPHVALNLLYMEERREITAAYYINTKELVEAQEKPPSFNGA